MTGLDMWPLKQRLSAAGYHVSIFHYRSVWNHLEKNLDQLKKFIEKIPGEQIHCVGHSLGGLLLQLLYERNEMKSQGRLVALGTPFNGCYVAERGRKMPLVPLFQGRTIADLMKLQQHGWRGTREFGVIAGNIPWGSGRLLGRLPSESDGLILIDETLLQGAKDHCVVAANHTGLLLSKKTSEQMIHFLENGTFLKNSVSH